MPSERRNLRSNKDTPSSTNGEKARSNSQSSNAKDKPVPTRSTSSRSKASSSKKSTSSGKESTGSKQQTKGTDPVENGVNGTEDVDMVDEGHEQEKANGEADEEMTVVVPPSKNPKLSSGHGKDPEGDNMMDDSEQPEPGPEEAEKIDPMAKAVSCMISTSIAR